MSGYTFNIMFWNIVIFTNYPWPCFMIKFIWISFYQIWFLAIDRYENISTASIMYGKKKKSHSGKKRNSHPEQLCKSPAPKMIWWLTTWVLHHLQLVMKRSWDFDCDTKANIWPMKKSGEETVTFEGPLFAIIATNWFWKFLNIFRCK